MHMLAFFVATSVCNLICGPTEEWVPAPIDVAYETLAGAGVGGVAGFIVTAIAVSPFLRDRDAAFPWVLGGSVVGVVGGATALAAYAANKRGGDPRQVSLVVLILSGFTVAGAGIPFALSSPDPLKPAIIVLASGGALTVVAAGVMQALTERPES